MIVIYGCTSCITKVKLLTSSILYLVTGVTTLLMKKSSLEEGSTAIIEQYVPGVQKSIEKYLVSWETDTEPVQAYAGDTLCRKTGNCLIL